MKWKKEEEIHILNVDLQVLYVKDNIFEQYYAVPSKGRLVIDNDCLDILENPNEMFYLTPLSKINKDGNKND